MTRIDSTSPRTRRPVRAARVLALTAVAALALTSCGNSDDATTAATTTPPVATSTPEPTRTTEPAPSVSPTADQNEGDQGTADEPGADAAAPGFATSAPDQAPSDDALLTVTNMRLGSHDGYDRLVLDLDGEGTPGWHVSVDDQAIEDPTDRVIDLGGAAAMRVILTGIGLPYETGIEELSSSTVLTGSGPAITKAAFTGTFEGQADAFAGLADPAAPFRIFLLQDPVRVVVDIQTS